MGLQPTYRLSTEYTKPGDPMAESGICVLCGTKGKVLRQRDSTELANGYKTYLGKALPQVLVDKYFGSTAFEYYCATCNFRNYEPALLGESDYYEWLGQTFDWYYSSGWDKLLALEYLQTLTPDRVVEIGSGNGWFLEQLTHRGLHGIGIDINEKAVAAAKERGLDVYLPGEAQIDRCDVLCLFQTIEHVSDPIGFLRPYIREYLPKTLLISAPCFESLLGYTTDPLAWPPHHRTAWSEKSFARLSGLLGVSIRRVWYQPLGFDEFQSKQSREGNGKLPGIPRIPKSRLGRIAFKFAKLLGQNWATREHSIMVEMG